MPLEGSQVPFSVLAGEAHRRGLNLSKRGLVAWISKSRKAPWDKLSLTLGGEDPMVHGLALKAKPAAESWKVVVGTLKRASENRFQGELGRSLVAVFQNKGHENCSAYLKMVKHTNCSTELDINGVAYLRKDGTYSGTVKINGSAWHVRGLVSDKALRLELVSEDFLRIMKRG
jgi:hypothetical protein